MVDVVKLKLTGKTKLVAQGMPTLAQAKRVIKHRLKSQGMKLSHYEVKEITKAARAFMNGVANCKIAMNEWNEWKKTNV